MKARPNEYLVFSVKPKLKIDGWYVEEENKDHCSRILFKPSLGTNELIKTFYHEFTHFFLNRYMSDRCIERNKNIKIAISSFSDKKEEKLAVQVEEAVLKVFKEIIPELEVLSDITKEEVK